MLSPEVIWYVGCSLAGAMLGFLISWQVNRDVRLRPQSHRGAIAARLHRRSAPRIRITLLIALVGAGLSLLVSMGAYDGAVSLGWIG